MLAVSGDSFDVQGVFRKYRPDGVAVNPVGPVVAEDMFEHQ